MRTAVLVFFYGCLCAGLWWAFAAWARRTCARHVDEGLKPNGNWAIVSDQFDNPGTAWSHENGEWGIRDPRIDRQVELAAGRPGQGEALAFFAEYHDVLTEAERILKEAAP